MVDLKFPARPNVSESAKDLISKVRRPTSHFPLPFPSLFIRFFFFFSKFNFQLAFLKPLYVDVTNPLLLHFCQLFTPPLPSIRNFSPTFPPTFSEIFNPYFIYIFILFYFYFNFNFNFWPPCVKICLCFPPLSAAPRERPQAAAGPTAGHPTSVDTHQRRSNGHMGTIKYNKGHILPPTHPLCATLFATLFPATLSCATLFLPLDLCHHFWDLAEETSKGLKS